MVIVNRLNIMVRSSRDKYNTYLVQPFKNCQEIQSTNVVPAKLVEFRDNVANTISETHLNEEEIPLDQGVCISCMAYENL